MNQRPSPAVQSRPKTLIFWASASAVLILAATLFIAPQLQNTAQSQSGSVLRISMGGWQPATVEARAGQSVSVTLINLDNSMHSDGAGWHNFIVEGQGVSERVAPEQTRSFSFKINKPGEYLFYCDICCGGKDNPFMRGKLIVQS